MATVLLRGLRGSCATSSRIAARFNVQSSPLRSSFEVPGASRHLRHFSISRRPVSASTLSHVSKSLLGPSAFFSSNPVHSKFVHPQFFSTAAPSIEAATAPAEEFSNSSPTPEQLTRPSVYNWLFGCSILVFGIVVVGGVTRLTESGLSITEWKPVSGTIPPITHQDWLEEFEKYKATPEFKLLNHGISLEEFKSIFYMEWGHRVLGRLIGLVYVLPFAYLVTSRRIPKTLTPTLGGLAVLLGLQGALGWYMVKSGLEDSLMETPGAVPRVSQYRLAAHLSAALVLYAGMLGTAMAARSDWSWANGSAAKKAFNADALQRFLALGAGRSFKRAAWGLLALVFTTAVSGAFVAGLDAGLLYNEFPLMGGRLAPPTNELFSTAYAKQADGSDLWWRNLFENPTTVQFDHRCLAMTTYGATLALFMSTRMSPALKAALPPLTKRAVTAVFHAANLQVLLGISTLLYLVPIPLAAAHQAGSVVLLSSVIGLLVSLRRPGAAAAALRRARAASAAPSRP